MPDIGPADPHALSNAQRLFMWLSGISIASLLIGDVIGIKLFRIPLGFSLPVPGGSTDTIVHTCGMLTFPITFLVTDLVNEFYGKRAARRIAVLSFSMALFAFAFINIGLAMPFLDAPYNVDPAAFNAVFGSARVMYVASLTAYLVGQFCDIAIFSGLKRLTGDRFIWLRATGSTVVSQMLDSLVVTYLAFSLGRRLFEDGAMAMSGSEVLRTAATGYMLKFVIAVAMTPLIYVGHRVIRRSLGMTPAAV